MNCLAWICIVSCILFFLVLIPPIHEFTTSCLFIQTGIWQEICSKLCHCFIYSSSFFLNQKPKDAKDTTTHQFFKSLLFRNQNVPQFAKRFLRNGKLFLLFEETFIKNSEACFQSSTDCLVIYNYWSVKGSFYKIF